MTVTVPEVAPVSMSKKKAWRVFIGRLIVDFIETFTGLIVPVQLFVPGNIEDWKRIALLLGAPAASAAVSALRRAWPTIKAWLEGE